MAKATKTITMNGGLVTSRDPSMLNEGELQLANGAEYHPGSQSVYKVKGRSKFNTTEAEAGYPVKGLYYAQYDDAADKLIAYANATYYEATAADTGTFSTGQGSVGSGATLKGAHYLNRHYLFNGVGNYNYCRQSDGTYRRMGMSAPGTEMTIALDTTTSPATVRPTASTTVSGFSKTYITPENAYDSSTGYEETYAKSDNTAAAAAIEYGTFPSITKTGWTLKISHYGTGLDPLNVYKFYYCTDYTTSKTWIQFFAGTLYYVRHARPRVGEPTSYKYEASVELSGSINANTVGFKAECDYSFANQYIYDIRLVYGGEGTLFDIDTGLTYWWTEYDSSEDTESSASVWVTSATGTNLIGVNISGMGTTATNSNADYKRIYRTVDGGIFPAGGLITTIPISQATYTDSNSDVDTLQFPPYNYVTVADVNYSRDDPPPIAKSAEIFQGSLCLIDANYPRYLYYSYPTQPESFPAVYYIDFDTNKNDSLIVTKRSGNLLGVFMNDQIWRIYRLPLASDSVFDSSIVKEIANSDIGCVSIDGVDSFSIGGDQRLAFVARNGIWMTNLFQFEPLTDDIDWDSTVNKAQLANSILINYPKKYQLRFYYASSGSSTNDKCLIFHYHPSHLKEGGRMKISGPVDANIASAALGVVSGEYKLWIGDSAAQAFAYLEDNGTDDDSNSYDTSGNINFDIKTADQYFGGIAGEFTTEEAYLHHAAHSGVDVTLTTNCLYDPRSTNRSWSLDKTIDLTRQGADNVFINRNAHRVNFEIKNQVKDEDVTLNHLTLKVTSLGDLEE